jgi:hypothetical protein
MRLSPNVSYVASRVIKTVIIDPRSALHFELKDGITLSIAGVRGCARHHQYLAGVRSEAGSLTRAVPKPAPRDRWQLPEFERNLIRERTGAGRVDAQKLGFDSEGPKR